LAECSKISVIKLENHENREVSMVSLEVYKMLHFVAIFAVVMVLGGIGFMAFISRYQDHPWRKAAAIIHGIGVFLILLSGFGMLARLGLTSGLPNWVIVKIAMLVFVAGVLMPLKRLPKLSFVFLTLVLIAVTFAGYVGSFKPEF
jgi:uncharacterized membrane protein